MGKNTQKIIWFSVGLMFLFSLGLVLPAEAAGASLFLSPPSGTYTIGSTFSVKVKVNSGGEAINAAEGTLIFNPNELNVVSLSKSGSIFTLWTTEATFSNSGGNIVFGGGTPSNFTGSSGTIITINFKAKATASAIINFSSGSVLAADGKGTNILADMDGGVYTLKPKTTEELEPEAPPPEEYIPPPTPAGTPVAPIISSPTHPEPDEWYSNDDPEFSWRLPSDVTGVSLLLHESSTGNPGPVSDGLIESKGFEDVEDGIWYFHVKFKNDYGWGKIAHRKVLIDTEPPESFEIKVDNEDDFTNPTPILRFDTTDSLSGIEYYEVKIGEGDSIPIVAAAIKTNPYKMSPQAPGRRTAIVKAIDGAGNSMAATADVKIEPIEMPVITEIPQTVRAGDILTIKGTSLYPDATVTVFVKKEGEEVRAGDVKTDNQGNWSFIYDKSLKKGTYQVWAEITDNRGARSNPTEKITIAATLPILIKIGGVAISYLAIIATFAILIAVLVGVIFYTRYQISIWRKRIRKETREVEETVLGAFKTLREEVQEQVENFDKKPGLTKREKRVRDKLQEALDISEKFIEKEIKDIEKELE